MIVLKNLYHTSSRIRPRTSYTLQSNHQPERNHPTITHNRWPGTGEVPPTLWGGAFCAFVTNPAQARQLTSLYCFPAVGGGRKVDTWPVLGPMPTAMPLCLWGQKRWYCAGHPLLLKDRNKHRFIIWTLPRWNIKHVIEIHVVAGICAS